MHVRTLLFNIYYNNKLLLISESHNLTTVVDFISEKMSTCELINSNILDNMELNYNDMSNNDWFDNISQFHDGNDALNNDDIL